MEILLVDGYNIIGASYDLQKLKEEDFAKARDQLVEMMAEYKAYKGIRVIVVFDAHLQKGVEKTYTDAGVEVIYTQEKEIADKKIEKLAIQLNNAKTQITVATSDYTEQWQIFGQGALRISARELLREIEKMRKDIEVDIGEMQAPRNQQKVTVSDVFPKEVTEKLEQLRRGNSP